MEPESEPKKIKVILDNLPSILGKEINKIKKHISEMKDDSNSLSIKLNQKIDNAENSFQQYEFLYYEVSSIKKSLIASAALITRETLRNILYIKNPNEAIYLLMKIFFLIITPDSSKDTLHWEFIQKETNNENFQKFVDELKNTNNIISKEKIDDAMPFLVNYDKLKELLSKVNNDLVTILDFIKITADYNIKLNIFNYLYSTNLKKNTKINNIHSEVSNLNNEIKEICELYAKMESDVKELNSLNYKASKTRNGVNNNNKIFGIKLIAKYNIAERYNVLREVQEGKKKYIIRLKAKYKDKDKLIEEIITSIYQYDENKFEQNLGSDALISSIINGTEDTKTSIFFDNKSQMKGFKHFIPKSYLGYNYFKKQLGYTVDRVKSNNLDEDDVTGGTLAQKTGSRIKMIPINSEKNLTTIKQEDIQGGTQRTKGTEKETQETSNRLYGSREITHRNNSVSNVSRGQDVNEKSTMNRKPSNFTVKGLKIESDKIELRGCCCCK